VPGHRPALGPPQQTAFEEVLKAVFELSRFVEIRRERPVIASLSLVEVLKAELEQ
jgi:hypothetical protein